MYPKHPDLLSFITFGGLSLLAGLCTLCLPETGDEDLPDTVAEAEHIGEHKKTEQYDDNTLVRSEDCAPTQYSEVIFNFDPVMSIYSIGVNFRLL